MKEDKIAMKRALNEYKGKQDYERLLKNYMLLESECKMAIKNGNSLADMLEESHNENDALKVAVIVLFNLLLAALVACGWLWYRD